MAIVKYSLSESHDFIRSSKDVSAAKPSLEPVASRCASNSLYSKALLSPIMFKRALVALFMYKYTHFGIKNKLFCNYFQHVDYQLVMNINLNV